VRRFLPKSLVGQIVLVMAVALLVAQSINFFLVLNERQRASLAQNEGPAISRFISVVQQAALAEPDERQEMMAERQRRGRFSLAPASLVDRAGLVREERLEHRVRQAASENGLVLSDVQAATVADEAGFRSLFADREQAFRAWEGWRGRELGNRTQGPGAKMAREFQLLVLSARLDSGEWVNGRLPIPRADPWLAARLALATLLLYAIVLGAMILVARRLARPLRDLTVAAERFEGRGAAPHVEPRGPLDLRHAIEAFNAMNRRVSVMLDEKDRMLGAIGHDLRTPLASLRIRAESMEPEDERQRVIATIEEMTAMLDDTLVLARSGRAREEARPMDLAALADTVVEEFRELGHKVELTRGERQVACIRPNLLRRAVRNLIDNAVKYGGSAEVSVTTAGQSVAIEIADPGPGIAEQDLELAQEPFYRLEGSRNRETGGSGLGLTIARAIAENHGGQLLIANRQSGGLSASLVIPRE
jgi:signal transduction histidine kinase